MLHICIPDNSGNIRKEIGEIRKVEEGAKKVEDGTEAGGMLDGIAAWFRGWGTWLVEVLVIGIVALITLCMLKPVYPSFIALLLKTTCRRSHEDYPKQGYKEMQREKNKVEMTPIHQDL
ncbi:hypothetical protein NDU88_003240 [Pleurodeles waltl]|uniref:Uncharacterized protein n=1 Tax=Pleurodeles waltl TaxID=8319 RepID=A0AAV7NIS8_PLEWA|nr:hypothetical protein NDU88_003240 [Pleurodeles waltl]